MLEIINLARRQEEVKQVIDWLWDEWGNRHNYNFFHAYVQHSLGEGDLPQHFGIFLDGQLMGSVALIRNDLTSRQDLTPWLSALYVRKEQRGKGYGSMLMEHVLKVAGDLGYRQVYLGSLHIGYYEKRGWRFLENGVLPSGDLIRIYCKETHASREK